MTKGPNVPAKRGDLTSMPRDAFVREADSVLRCLFYAPHAAAVRR